MDAGCLVVVVGGGACADKCESPSDCEVGCESVPLAMWAFAQVFEWVSCPECEWDVHVSVGIGISVYLIHVSLFAHAVLWPFE